jgi:hypothetical protein
MSTIIIRSSRLCVTAVMFGPALLSGAEQTITIRAARVLTGRAGR